MIRRAVILGLLFLGCASAYAGDVTSVSRPIQWQTLRGSIAVADTASVTLDDASITKAIPVLLNPNQCQNVAVSLKFTNSGATCVVHFVRGWTDGVNFFPKDQTVTTFTALIGKLRGLYTSNTVVYAAEGFNAFAIIVEAPSAGSVDTDGGVY